VTRLAVIVVTFNSEPDLPACLSAVDRAGLKTVVIFDNGSQDASAAIAISAGARTFESEANLGFGSAVNRAMSAVTQEYALLLNPDCLVTAGCISRLVEVMDADPGLAAVVPAMRYPDGRPAIAGGAFPSLLKELLGAVRARVVVPHATVRWLDARALPGRLDRLMSYARTEPGSGTLRTDWVSGCCMLIRRSAFELVGGFDEDFFLYFEDADLCNRLRALGLTVGVVRDVEVVHQESTATRRVGKSSLYASGMKVYFRKHGTRSEQLAIGLLAAVMR
jgi:N-acetylglucosaminyl-diphospho-decaprenol L-rhamnosyltransferase